MGGFTTKNADIVKNNLLTIFRKHEEVLFWLSIGLSLNVAFLLFRDAPLVADEGFHLPQIAGFLSGNFETSPHLAMSPVYHAIIASLLHLIGAESVAEARLISFLGSVVSIWVFYLIVSRLWPQERFLRTIQFTFLPILFPMHFVIYTDGWALVWVLIAVERSLAGRPWQSAAAIAVATLLRQPNIVWAVFLWIFTVWKPGSLKYTWLAVRSQWFQSTLPFVVVCLGFVAFFVFNRGIAIGDRQQQEIGFNLSNVWFFGLCFFLLFLPTCVGNIQRLWARLRCHSLVTSGGLLAGLPVFIATYQAAHQYNQATLWFYLRNRLLYWTSYEVTAKAVTYLPSIAGLAGFVLAPMRERRFVALVPITLVAIVVMPLIEQRYYLAPLALFLAFRRLESPLWEWVNTVAWIVASYLLLVGIEKNAFFL